MNKPTTRKIIIWSLFVITGAVGALQMFNIRLGIFTSQGADFFAPALLYFLTRDGKTLIRYLGVNPKKPVVVAVAMFVLCVGWEIMQKIRLIPGVFDWYDLLAHALGIAGAFILDEILSKGERH